MSRDDVRRFLIAYDISDYVRRASIAATLQSYGDRVQYSIFIVDTRPAKLLRLRAQLSALIDQNTDSLLFCDLGPLHNTQRDQLDVIGRSRTITDHGPAIL